MKPLGVLFGIIFYEVMSLVYKVPAIESPKSKLSHRSQCSRFDRLTLLPIQAKLHHAQSCQTIIAQHNQVYCTLPWTRGILISFYAFQLPLPTTIQVYYYRSCYGNQKVIKSRGSRMLENNSFGLKCVYQISVSVLIPH